MSISWIIISLLMALHWKQKKGTANFPLMMLTKGAWIRKTNDKHNIGRTTNGKMLWSTKLIIITTDAGYLYVWSLMRVLRVIQCTDRLYYDNDVRCLAFIIGSDFISINSKKEQILPLYMVAMRHLFIGGILIYWFLQLFSMFFR